MSRYRHLPIWKAALDLAVHLEHAVRRFPRYHKYTLGSALRQTAQRVRRRLKRAGQAHALAARTGHLKSGFERREVVLIWRPSTHSSFLSTSSGGAS